MTKYDATGTLEWIRQIGTSEPDHSVSGVSVDGQGVSRYSREVEAAVYFSVLEALQNTTKYADASTVTIGLSAGDGMLTFEVADDGNGFDMETVTRGAGLNGIADRLDTVGGTIHVDSTPGAGTTVTGSIPVPERAPVASELA